MGNCGSTLDCQQCYSRTGNDGCLKEIDVDSDIAGIGVLIAFFLSAVMTVTAIFWGVFLQRCRISCLARNALAWLKYDRNVKALVIRNHQEEEHNENEDRERRVQAIIRFVLAMSDQQLVTGIAIMTAALSARCHITVFELRIVDSLAWFSATSHLATLSILRQYMYENPVVRNWRVLGIIVFLALLGTIQGILGTAGNVMVYMSKTLNPATIIQCLISGNPKPHTSNHVAPFSLMRVMSYGFIIALYADSILKWYSEPPVERRPNLFAPFYRIYVRFRFGYGKEDAQNVTERVHASVLETVFTELLRKRPTPLGPRSFLYGNSFLIELSPLLFSLVFGFSKTITNFFIHKPQLSSHIRQMKFGQVVAIALIALPILTAMEIHYESKIAYRNRTDTNIQNSTAEARNSKTSIELGALSPPIDQHPTAQQRSPSIASRSSQNSVIEHSLHKYVSPIGRFLVLDFALGIVGGIVMAFPQASLVITGNVCIGSVLGIRGALAVGFFSLGSDLIKEEIRRPQTTVASEDANTNILQEEVSRSYSTNTGTNHQTSPTPDAACFGLPARHDTEADIGINTVPRRLRHRALTH